MSAACRRPCLWWLCPLQPLRLVAQLSLAYPRENGALYPFLGASLSLVGFFCLGEGPAANLPPIMPLWVLAMPLGPHSIDILQKWAGEAWFQAQWSSLSSHSCSTSVFTLFLPVASPKDIWTGLAAMDGAGPSPPPFCMLYLY